MKKLIIFGIIIIILMGSVISVSAKTVTIRDDSNDVSDVSGEIIKSNDNNNAKNIDITEIKCSQQNQSVTIELKVKGKIANEGSFDYFDDDFDFENIIGEKIAIYIINIETLYNSYEIYYINEECMLNGEMVNCQLLGNKITITFELNEPGEVINYIRADSTYNDIKSLHDYESLFDNIEKDNLIDEFIDSQNNNNQDIIDEEEDNDEITVQQLLNFYIFIGILCIIIVVIVVVLIKRR